MALGAQAARLRQAGVWRCQTPAVSPKPPLYHQSPHGRGSGGKPHLLCGPLRLCAFARTPARTLPTESWMGEGFGERVKVWLHLPPIHLHCLHLQLIACKLVSRNPKEIRHFDQHLHIWLPLSHFHLVNKCSAYSKTVTNITEGHVLSFAQSTQFFREPLH